MTCTPKAAWVPVASVPGPVLVPEHMHELGTVPALKLLLSGVGGVEVRDREQARTDMFMTNYDTR